MGSPTVKHVESYTQPSAEAAIPAEYHRHAGLKDGNGQAAFERRMRKNNDAAMPNKGSKPTKIVVMTRSGGARKSRPDAHEYLS